MLVKEPKSKAGIRRLALYAGTVQSLRMLRQEMVRLCGVAQVALEDRHFVFTSEPPGDTPPYPDAVPVAVFAAIRDDAGVAPDIHLHSLRHFQATALDPVISEAQKQARLGWSTVHMARHYTDVIGEEDPGGRRSISGATSRREVERRAALGTEARLPAHPPDPGRAERIPVRRR